MDALKKFFPMSFKYTKSGTNLAKGIILYIFAAIVAGLLITIAGLLIGWLPVVGAIIGWLLRVLGSLVEIYVVAGIVIQILVFAKVLKD